MKRLFLISLLLLAVAGMTMAQEYVKPRNPVEGYIITNENDTIHGTVDFLTGEENALACHFQCDGDTIYHSYAPGEIKGFRLYNGGVYYVTRTMPINGNDSTIFAEYLLQGSVSLYRYEDKDDTYYYMTDTEGRIAAIKEDDFSDYSEEEALQMKTDNLRGAAEILDRSPWAKRTLWENPISAANLMRVARRYNEMFGKDNGASIDFAYNGDKARKYETRFIFEAGFSVGNLKSPGISISTKMPHISLGCEFRLPRKNPNLAHQLMAFAGSYDNQVLENGIYRNQTDLWVEIDYGLLYRFPTGGKNRPFIGGGISLSVIAGAYVGAGYEFGIGRHQLRIAAKGKYRGLTLLKSMIFDDVVFDSMATASLDISFVI